MSGRFALVTGTSRGLGAQLAEVLLETGWTVSGLARGGAPAELSEHAGYHHDALDLTDLAQVSGRLEARLQRRLAELGEVDRVALVNNAGMLAPMGPLHRAGGPELARSALLNVGAPLWLMGCAVRLAQDTPLRVINVSSGAATRAYPGWGAYCAGKAAQRMAGEVLALEHAEVDELAGRDVAVVDYAPGIIATEMQAEIRAADPADFPRQARFVDYHRDGALVDPIEPAREIAALLERDDLPSFSARRFGEAAS